MAVLTSLGALIFLVRRGRKSRERNRRRSYFELSNESKHGQRQGVQEMFQMPPEMEENPRPSAVAELGGDGAPLPAELSGGYEAIELNGSAR